MVLESRLQLRDPGAHALQLLLEGKISDEVFEEWNRSAGSKELPERLHPKRDGPAKRTPAPKAKKAPKARKARKAKKAASTRLAKKVR